MLTIEEVKEIKAKVEKQSKESGKWIGIHI
jgi:hypothetical protein